ncbi:hypothetical protein ACFPYJ_31070 [Paenibacillus solisilvae]|uniref:Uncharacterized protein n=1 Tax=Paenibacillus solisilvae TaxID=2486751 RepID=A0ABW0W717_9BACL
MALTTGYITNTRNTGTAATNVVLNLVNENQSNAATVLVKIFYSQSPDVKIPLYVNAFTLPVNSIRRAVFFVQGVLAYEVQYNVSSATPNDVILSSYGLDEFGNIVQEQRVLHSELNTISALSPS